MQILDFERKDVFVIQNLWKMALKDKYLGSFLGISWAFLQPALFLALYTFIFTFIFKVRSPGETGGLSNIIWLFSGTVPYLVFSEAIGISANSIIASSSLVKNIVFKSETIPIAFTLTSIVTLGVGSFFLLVLLFLNGQSLTWYALLIIPVIILQFLFLIGLAFFISATTVFFRDILQIIPTILMVFLFFTPIYYSIDILPPFAAKITFFNPLYQMVQSYRDVLILHTFPNIFGLIYLLLLSILMIIVGLAYFRRLKGYFELAL
jgi:lipopolysaccharide transport system permease protein